MQARWTNKIHAHNERDDDGNPTGGNVRGIGLSIDWQDGPLGRGLDKREPNGAFLEDVLLALIERLRFYQSSKRSCRHNGKALIHLEEALHWLQARHDDREEREVQGTNQE